MGRNPAPEPACSMTVTFLLWGVVGGGGWIPIPRDNSRWLPVPRAQEMCARPTPEPPRGLPFRKGMRLLWPQGPAPSPIPVAPWLDHHHHQHSHLLLLHRGLRSLGMGGSGGGTPRGHDLETQQPPRSHGDHPYLGALLTRSRWAGSRPHIWRPDCLST